MSYFNAAPGSKISVDKIDNFQNDAFSRTRISSPLTVLANKQIYNSDGYWSVYSVTGSTYTFISGTATVRMNVSSSSGSHIIRQSKRRAFYNPGNSMFFCGTMNMGSGSSGIVKRYGLYDGTDGCFFEQSGSVLSWNIMNSGSVVEKIIQNNWNVDKLDGTTESKINLDITKAQIILIDFQWLGVGRVRCGFDIDGIPYITHQFNHANYVTGTYMGNPNLPVRVEIKNELNINSGSLNQICVGVISEGLPNINQIATSFAASRYLNYIPVASGTITPLMSLRVNPTKPSTIVLLESINIIDITGVNCAWFLYKNPTFSTDTANWQNVSGSFAQYDISRTGSIAAGTLLYSGYNTSVAKNVSANFNADINSENNLGVNLDGTSEELTLGVLHGTSAGAPHYFGASIGWKELV